MIRLYKPARSKQVNRGLFSYLTESVLNMSNFVYKNGDDNIKYYHDLFDIPGYVHNNLFDVCFVQDEIDYKKNINLYQNIEETENLLKLDPYQMWDFNLESRLLSEKIINKFFVPNLDLKNLLINRQNQINFENTIGVHRRSTDITMHHNIVDLNKLFDSIDLNDFDSIFLMCDNLNDHISFKKRYGNKIITYDEFTSEQNNLPFFKINKDLEKIKKHIQEMVFGVLTLSKTKNLICSRSNLSAFSILANSKLNYKILM